MDQHIKIVKSRSARMDGMGSSGAQSQIQAVVAGRYREVGGGETGRSKVDIMYFNTLDHRAQLTYLFGCVCESYRIRITFPERISGECLPMRCHVPEI